jgi:DNA primase
LQSLEDVLKEQGIFYALNPNNPSEITVRCFSGLHEDKNPSLSLNLDKGVFNCFSCGFRGNTQQFFEGLGVTQVPQIQSKLAFKIRKLKTKLEQIKSKGEIRLPEPNINIRHEFKGISAKVLQDFGVFFTEANGLSDYVCVPIYQHKKLKFIEGRYKVLNNNSDKPKYLRKPSGVSVSDILFPLDKITDFSHIILVEGLFDVLKLHELGYTNSLCIFGTQNFTTIKAKILDEYGCRKVTILMDGDNAGKLAANKIKKLLEQRSIETEIVTLPKDIDPGMLDEEAAEFFLGKNKETF